MRSDGSASTPTNIREYWAPDDLIDHMSAEVQYANRMRDLCTAMPGSRRWTLTDLRSVVKKNAEALSKAE